MENNQYQNGGGVSLGNPDLEIENTRAILFNSDGTPHYTQLQIDGDPLLSYLQQLAKESMC